ncbi:MAG: L,D-transpeptidase [Rhodoplanes sp.]|uniref:L,D-transpeptidase n=1 Tax=Rhodoplanes sp. TaxID=1968906 RepID=UPI001791CF45|nr:L,D-transpeptidase [Rhodoplanes sp.]NVO13211.1 L,D-transpeptidase [Rhodoplanes sp.]
MLNRRRVLYAATGLTLIGGLAAVVRAQEVVKDARDLKPGEFTWDPARSPDGPVAVIVSIPDQRVHVYRNGIRIAVSTCSTGKPGHETPTGVFTILEKDKNHHSSTYDNAPMPNMNRLTWQGVALHAGNLPGYPASHGCVRLPVEFSRRLFDVTHVGTPVILAGAHGDPAQLVHPGLVLSDVAKEEFEKKVAELGAKQHPKDWPEAAPGAPREMFASVVVTRADRRVRLFADGEVVAEGEAIIEAPDRPLGSHVYVLDGGRDGVAGLVWHAFAHTSDMAAELADVGALHRVRTPPALDAAIHAHMHPGMIMVLSDQTGHPDTVSAKDFVVMAQDEG